jgi:hypothetical protein
MKNKNKISQKTLAMMYNMTCDLHNFHQDKCIYLSYKKSQSREITLTVTYTGMNTFSPINKHENTLMVKTEI